MRPQFINKPQDVVVECLDGMVARLDSNVVLLGQDRDVKVVVRKDWDPKTTEKVALISGGGSGHEPAHAGYVGKGMLTAAVCGEVFASPPVKAIVSAIRAVCGKPGCLLIVKNYTGDCLNFGLAMRKANAEGLKCDMVVVADDCAFDEQRRRRGLAGTVLVHKIAGYVAETGGSLEKVVKTAQQVIRDVGTLGVSSDCCQLFGQKKDDRVPAESLELGLGIHGEPGRQVVKSTSVDELVKTMIGVIEKDHEKRNLTPSDQCYLALINNLGATTPLEIGVVGKAVQDCLGKRLHSLFAGPYMTSLNMPGFSLTLLPVNSEEKEEEVNVWTAVSSPTEAAGWVRGYKVGKSVIQAPPTDEVKFPPKPADLPKACAKTKAALVAAAKALVAAKDELNTLDRVIGDGDCGSTMEIAGNSILKGIEEVPIHNLKASARWLAMVAEKLGGSSGALYAIMWTAVSEKLPETATCTAAEAAAAWQFGLDQMMKIGQGRPGDRTMLDAMLPACRALSSGKLDDVKAEAEKGAKSTESMKQAGSGRAAYVPEEKLKGTCDPGAKAAAAWIGAVVTTLRN